MTNNELSRKVLETLTQGKKSMRFNELVQAVGAEPRAVFKNLFFLEEKGLVQLSTSYPTDAVYPQVHLIRLRKVGEELAADPEKLDRMFPLSEDLDAKLQESHGHDKPGPGLTYARALEVLAARVREEIPAPEQDPAIEKIEALLGLPFINDRILD